MGNNLNLIAFLNTVWNNLIGKVAPEKPSIYVCRVVNEHIKVNIDRDPTVRQLKEEILKKYGIDVENQVLYFNRRPLDDENKTLSACGIEDAYQVNVTDKTTIPGFIIIFVKTSKGISQFPYLFPPHSTLEDLQEKLAEHKSSPNDPDLVILFDGKLQADSSVKLETFGNGSTVEAYAPKSTNVAVQWDNNSNDCFKGDFKIDVDDFETGHSFMMRVQLRAVSTVDRIYINDERLEYNVLMRKYKLDRDAVVKIYASEVAAEAIKVIVKRSSQDDIEVKTHSVESVYSLMEHIEKTEKIPVKAQNLYLGKLQKDCQLLEWKSLHESNVTNGCIIHLLTRTEIEVNHRNTSHTLEVDLIDFVFTVKDKLKEETGIPADAQILIHDGMELFSGHTLASYNVQKGSTLQLVTRSRGY